MALNAVEGLLARGIGVACCLAMIAACALPSRAELKQSSTQPAPTWTGERVANKSSKPEPVYSEYRGIALGAMRDDILDKLGKPKTSDKTSDTYVVSKQETATFYYDDAHHAIAVVATYTGKGDQIPTAKAVFGSDVDPNDDGSINQLIRYETEGYWVSYNLIPGDDPVVVVTMKKIRRPTR